MGKESNLGSLSTTVGCRAGSNQIWSWQGRYVFSFFPLDRGDMWTASHPTPGLSSRRQSELKTRSGQRNGPKIGSTFKNNFFLTICTNHGKICGLLCCNGRYQLLREILYYQYIFVKYCGEFHCFISSSGFDVQDRTNPFSNFQVLM